MDVLSSRILVRPSDLDRSRRFYRDVLGLAIYREFGPPDDPGVVFFLGPGLFEVSGHRPGPAGQSVMIWMQVRDVHAEHARLAAAAVPIIRGPAWRAVWGALKSNSVYTARFAYLTSREHNKLSTGQAHAAIAAALLRHLHAVITTGQRWDPAIAAGGRPTPTLIAA